MNTITAQSRIPCGQYIFMEHRRSINDGEKINAASARSRREYVLLFKELIGCFLSHGDSVKYTRMV